MSKASRIPGHLHAHARARRNCVVTAVLLMSIPGVRLAWGDPAEPAICGTTATSRDVRSRIGAGDLVAAERLCRDGLRARPQDDELYGLLVQIANGRAVASNSRSYQLADARLPASFLLHQTDRFVLLSDADEALTGRHARWVERTYQEFQRLAADLQLRPLPLEHKLVCILFQRRQEYQDFARANDEVTNSAISGYYSPRNDRVVFSLDAGIAQARAMPSEPAEAGPAQLPGKMALNLASADSTPSAPRASRGIYRFNQAAAGPTDSAAKCVHETIHQLMFHTRVMAPEIQYPLWVCEGMSTAFETDDPEAPFGPDHDFAPRRRVFQRLLVNDGLLPLRELVGMAQLPRDDQRAVNVLYHQSYALVSWMCANRPAELRAYLTLMLSEPAGRLTSARHLDIFERAFGPVSALEKCWLTDERSHLMQD